MKLDEFRLPMDEFVVRAHSYIPATYGKMVGKKICHDSKNKMRELPQYDGRGDTTISSKLYYEVKTSYLNGSNRFGIKNIRPWQPFDNFILCLFDTTNNKYTAHYYCVPRSIILESPILVLSEQNSSKGGYDEKMEKVGLSTTFDLNDHSWLFKKDNLLKGTTYKDLLNYIDNQYVCNHKTPTPKEKPIIQSRKPIQKIYLKMGKHIIDGDSNREVMIKLVKYVGPSKLDGVIWSTWLNKHENVDRNTYVGDGYYFNPKFSIRDLTTTVNQINKKLNLSFNIINK